MGPKGYRLSDRTKYPILDDSNEKHGGHALTGVLLREKQISFRQITDGSSHTLMVGEISTDDFPNYRGWGRGSSLGSATVKSAEPGTKNLVQALNSGPPTDFNDAGYGSKHTNGAHFLFCDGSVHFVSDDVDLQILFFAATRNGEEPSDGIL
jgi:prepilin-type processing-associated H-X9-DG protein